MSDLKKRHHEEQELLHEEIRKLKEELATLKEKVREKEP